MEDTKLSLCPICIGPLEFPRNLCDANYKSLLELLHKLLGFQVELPFPGLFNICRTCEGKLTWVSEFKSLCEKSLERFKSIECKKELTDFDEFAQSLQSAPVDLNTDSDSDNRTLIVRKKRKKLLKQSRPTSKRHKVDENVENTTSERRSRSKQYPSKEVSEALSENKSSKDLSNRSCLHCDYVSSASSELLCHMQIQHEKLFQKWCQDCNEQTSNLKKHQDGAKCNEFRCKFCTKSFTKRHFLTRHLRTHCHEEAVTSEKSEDENEQNLDSKEDLKSEVDNSVKEGIDNTSKDDSNKVVDLDDAFNSGIDSDYTPDKSDSDSDNDVKQTRADKKIARPLPKRKIKPRGKGTNEKSIKERKGNPKHLKQFSEKEVLEAIAQFESYMTDIKNRKCIHCEYNAVNAKSLRMHMTFKHKEEFRTWCKHCNIQTDNLQIHRQNTKCHQEFCKFCNQISPVQKNFAQHLRSHCKKVKDNRPLEEARWKACEQYPKEKVFEAISICTTYRFDIKNRSCLFCDYVATSAKTLTVHIRFGHKDYFDSWCGRCNIQTDNLKLHTETAKCVENRCTFCDKTFPTANRLIRHLESHCRDAFKNPGENSDWEDDLPILKSATQFLNPVVSGVATTQNPEDDSSTFWFKQDPCTDNRLSNTNAGINVKGEEEINEIQEDESNSNWDKSSPISSAAENSDTDSSDSDKAIINSKKANVKQFPMAEVQRAITEALKPFYNNRKCVICNFIATNSKTLGEHLNSHKNVKNKWCKLCNTLVSNVTKHFENHKKDVLKCCFCDVTCESLTSLKAHLKRHCNSHTFELTPQWHCCTTCPSAYPTEKQLKNHSCKKPVRLHFCLICKMRVTNIRIHNRNAHKPKSILRRIIAPGSCEKLCPICGKILKNNQNLIVHMRKHTGEKPFICSYCHKRFRNRTNLREHERRHTGERPYVCHVCGKGFVSNGERRQHMLNHEGGSVTCTICNKEFSRPASLTLHMKHHTGENPYACVECGMSYHRPSLLKNHMRSHSSERPYKCSFCEKDFSWKDKLKIHERVHKGENLYTCIECGVPYNTPSLLKNHVRSHNERPYKCSFCEKDFASKSTLNKHEKVHKGIKPYKCSVCSFSCTLAHGLSSHMKQHPEDSPQADRPYKCLFCRRQFDTNAMLMSHTNNQHRDATR